MFKFVSFEYSHPKKNQKKLKKPINQIFNMQNLIDEIV